MNMMVSSNIYAKGKIAIYWSNFVVVIFTRIILDLHGLTREQAKMELAALLLACENEHVYCASIMTGYGTFTLKNKFHVG